MYPTEYAPNVYPQVHQNPSPNPYSGHAPYTGPQYPAAAQTAYPTSVPSQYAHYDQQQYQDPYAKPPPQYEYYNPATGSQQPIGNYVVYNSHEIPLGMILFFVGFFCPPAWWIASGACCIGDPITKRDFTWRKINRIMTVLSLIACVVIAVLLAVVVYNSY